eukprot:scaffold1521_cov271-Chaetoceros_neogracile.AAC.48
MREKGQNVNMQNYVLPTTGAKNNEVNGLGPFQGSYMTQEAADINIFQILEQHNLKHDYLLKRMVKQNNAAPNHDLSEEELNEVRPLSDKERNEFIAQMDQICKLKGSLHQLLKALMNRTAIAIESYDPDFKKNMLDIYVEIVEHSSDNRDGTGNLSFKFCHQAYKGHVKIVDRGRYIVVTYVEVPTELLAPSTHKRPMDMTNKGTGNEEGDETGGKKKKTRLNHLYSSKQSGQHH